VSWRAVGVLCLALLLGGCLKDQQQQLVKCGAEGVRAEAVRNHVIWVPANSVRQCMNAAGYDFDTSYDFCHSNRTIGGYEVTDFCYRPVGKIARFWTDLEVSTWVH
jgi:hypothetical protein